MEDLLTVLKIVFLNNFPILLLLSVSWVFVYVIFKLIEKISLKLLLRFPIYLCTRLFRVYYGIPRIRNNVLKNKPIPHAYAEHRSFRIGKAISKIDKRISKLSSGKNHIGNILFRCDGIKRESEDIFRRDILLLEGDQAFCDVASRDTATVERGLLNVVGNPSLQNDIANTCFHVLQFGPQEVHQNALYLIKHSINDETQLAKLENLTSQWIGSKKLLAQATSSEVRSRLERKGLMLKSRTGEIRGGMFYQLNARC
jgi:hypothetical protein